MSYQRTLEKKGLVSTVIPVFNRSAMIVEAVGSVLAQDYRPIEIIVVDDGSTDDTPLVLTELANKHAELRVFRQDNAGPGVARETGRLNARGEFIQYLDSDDLLLPSKFKEQVAALNTHSDCVACYGKTEDIKIGAPVKGVASRLTGQIIPSMFPAFLHSRWWATSTPLYRTKAVQNIGPWSELINEEDWEYDCRLASQGGRLAYVDSFVSLQRQHGDHLCQNGATDPRKLRDRSLARAKIFHHAQHYMTLDDRPAEITRDDWVLFSKALFLLGRQCALAGLSTEARALVRLSIDANGRKTARHFLFLKLVRFLGWQRAARTINAIGK